MEQFYHSILAQADNEEGTPSPAPTGNESNQAETQTTQTETETSQTESTTKQPDPGATDKVPAKKKPGLMDSGFLWVILAMFVVIYFVMMRPQKKKQQEHRNMLGNLKKNDRVRTIGGIIGTVVDVRDEEVVLKIDEANNTKMRFIRNAIGSVLTEEVKEQK